MIISVVKPFSLHLKWSKKKKKISKLTFSVFVTTKNESGKDKKELVDFKVKEPTKKTIHYLSFNIFGLNMGNLGENESVSSGCCPDCFICTDEELKTLYGICTTDRYFPEIFIIEENENLKKGDSIPLDTIMAYRNDQYLAQIKNYQKQKNDFLYYFSAALIPKNTKTAYNLISMLVKCYEKTFTDNTGKVWSSVFKPEEFGFSNAQLEELKIFEIRKLKSGIRISSNYLQNIL